MAAAAAQYSREASSSFLINKTQTPAHKQQQLSVGMSQQIGFNRLSLSDLVPLLSSISYVASSSNPLASIREVGSGRVKKKLYTRGSRVVLVDID